MTYVGIDAASNKHDYAIMNDKGNLILEPITITNDMTEFKNFIQKSRPVQSFQIKYV